MHKMIPRILVDRLVDIGQKESFSELQDIGAEFPEARNGNFMRLDAESWALATSELSVTEIVSLIRCLTRIERHNGFGAGSVSPVIWLFRKLPEEQQRPDLVSWILENTENPYLPFGSSNHGAKSHEEYLRQCISSEERRATRKSAEQERQAKAKRTKAEAASLRMFGAIRRRDEQAIRALFSRGADTKAIDSSGQTVLQAAEAAGLIHVFDLFSTAATPGSPTENS